MYSTPSRSSNPRNAPSTSYSPTVTGNGHQKLNVVTRIAIEGKAKQGQDGVSVKMFLKARNRNSQPLRLNLLCADLYPSGFRNPWVNHCSLSR